MEQSAKVTDISEEFLQSALGLAHQLQPLMNHCVLAELLREVGFRNP